MKSLLAANSTLSPGLVLCSAVLLSYLVGSIPFGYLTGRLVGGIDIRRHGSGNIGATNVGRVLGRKWFVIVLLLDFLKGFGPVWVFPDLMTRMTGGQAASSSWYVQQPHTMVFCGLGAIAGHLWPIALRFRGGKGVATGLGVVVVIAPEATVVAALCGAAVVLLTRYVSVGSILAATVFAVWQLVTLAEPFASNNLTVTCFSLLLPILIAVRHRSNLKRLREGTEPRTTFGRKKSNGAETK